MGMGLLGFLRLPFERPLVVMKMAQPALWPPHHHSSRTMWEAIFILTCNFPQYIQYTMMGLLREIRFNTSALITKCYSTMTSVIHIVTPTTTSAIEIEISGIFYFKKPPHVIVLHLQLE